MKRKFDGIKLIKYKSDLVEYSLMLSIFNLVCCSYIYQTDFVTLQLYQN